MGTIFVANLFELQKNLVYRIWPSHDADTKETPAADGGAAGADRRHRYASEGR